MSMRRLFIVLCVGVFIGISGAFAGLVSQPGTALAHTGSLSTVQATLGIST